MKNKFMSYIGIFLLVGVVTLSVSCEEEEPICETTVYYADTDNDALGDPNNTIEACERPEGYVEDNTDDDDTVSFCDAVTWYQDLDGNGLGNEDESTVSCDQPEGYVDNGDDVYKFFLALSLPATEQYPLHILMDAEGGTADIVGSQEITGLPDGGVPVISESGFVYLNSELTLSKFSVNENGILEEEGSVLNTGISGGPIATFLDDNRMLVSTGERASATGEFTYQIINTGTMAEESNGTFTVPVDESSLAYPNGYYLKEGKIYLPYIHSDEDFVAYDEAPIAIFDATTMEYEKTIYTDKTASLGYSVISDHGTDEDGNLYIISCNSNYWGANETLPSGIVRINAGETEFDDTYFFNLTEKLDDNHSGGMLYVGNGKAIVQMFRGDLIEGYSDYQGGFVIEYYEVDLVAQTTQKLDIPLCKYPRKVMSLLKNGKALIAGNTEEDGNNLYIYDPADGSISKGLEYTGAEFINAFMSFE